MKEPEIKQRVYVSERLKESSLDSYIKNLGYIPTEEINILRDAKFACLCSNLDVRFEVSIAVKSGVPVILVSEDKSIHKKLESDCLDNAFPSHKGKHACFDKMESIPVITWIDHCFEKIAKEFCEKWHRNLGKLFIEEEKKRRKEVNNELSTH